MADTIAPARIWNVNVKDFNGDPTPAGIPMVIWGQGPDTNPINVPVTVAVDSVNPGRAAIIFDDMPVTSSPYTFVLSAKGFGSNSFRGDLPPVGSTEGRQAVHTPTENIDGLDPYPLPRLEPSVGPFPGKPTRAQVCGVNLTFQGLIVETQQWGVLPWFEPALMLLSSSDRQSVYAAKHAAGDTHCLIGVGQTVGGPLYPEDGNPYFQFINQAYDVAEAAAEIILNGFHPIIVFDGDGNQQSNVDTAFAQIPYVLGKLQASAYGDLVPYCLLMPAYDGWFYGWPNDQVNIPNWAATIRAAVPDANIGGEFNHLPLGNGPSDYGPDALMQNYDVLLHEVPDPFHGNGFWGIASRCLGPAYITPPDDCVNDSPPCDSNPRPWYFAPGTARGPISYVCFEWSGDVGLYKWVRVNYPLWQAQVTDRSQSAVYHAELQAAQVPIVQTRAYARSCGCSYTG